MKKILTILSLMFATCGASVAQDRLASVAPIDHKMRAIDSISLIIGTNMHEGTMFVHPENTGEVHGREWGVEIRIYDILKES